MKNQAAVLYAPHDIRLEERPVPRPGPGEVLIEIKAVGVCGSDTGTFRYANTYADAIALVASGRIDLKPIITGHYALEETEQALQATRQDPANIKSIVLPKQSSSREA